MRASLDPQARCLNLAFSSASAARRYLAEVRSVNGLQVELDHRLSQYDVARVTVELEGATREAFNAYAARVHELETGRFQTAFVVQDWSESGERELLEWLEAPRPAEVSEQRTDAPAGKGEVRGIAAVHELKKMNPSQRAIRAQRADRAERQVLLRDNTPQVLQGLLVNPRVEAKEILRIAKSTYATAAILQRIAGDARWGKNQEILAAVTRNPKSPTLVVTRLLDKLRTSDLRQMAKMSSGLKETVRKAALREYMKRSGQS